MEEINLYRLIKYYSQKWYIILALTLLGLVCGFVYNQFIQQPLYRSDAKLILLASENQTSISRQTDVNNYIELIQSRRVLQPIIDNNVTNMGLDELTRSVQPESKKDTNVIDIVVTSDDSEQSKNIANGVTASFKQAVSQIYGSDKASDKFVTVDPAIADSKPYNVNQLLQLLVAAAVGFAVAIIGIFFVFDYRSSEAYGTSPKAKSNTVKDDKDTNTKWMSSRPRRLQ